MSVQSHTRIWEALTTRRVQVAAGLADGKTEKQIARELGIEETTVKDHVKHLREIFGEPDARRSWAFLEDVSGGMACLVRRGRRTRSGNNCPESRVKTIPVVG